jgi:hypothetical protein
MYQWIPPKKNAPKRKNVRTLLRDRMKRITMKMCRTHYIENTFGLWPYICTKKCQAERSKHGNIVAAPKDWIVWVTLESVLSLRTHPKCTWCGRKMKGASVEDQNRPPRRSGALRKRDRGEPRP